MDRTTKLSIKGMVCNRCILVVNRELEKLGLEVIEVQLGKAEIAGVSESASIEEIETKLEENGLELIYSKEERMVREIKQVIDKRFSQTETLPSKSKISEVLCVALPYSYDMMSQAFSFVEGFTLEKYLISKRLEKVKELLVCSKNTLTEIAYITGFSSIHHLSNQFQRADRAFPFTISHCVPKSSVSNVPVNFLVSIRRRNSKG